MARIPRSGSNGEAKGIGSASGQTGGAEQKANAWYNQSECSGELTVRQPLTVLRRLAHCDCPTDPVAEFAAPAFRENE